MALLCSALMFGVLESRDVSSMQGSRQTLPDVAAAALGRSCCASHPCSAHQPDDRVEGSSGNPGQQPKPQ